MKMKHDEEKPAAAAPDKDGAAPEAPKKGRKGRIALVVAAVLAVLIVAAALAGGGSKDAADEPFDPASYEKAEYAAVARGPDSYKDKKLYFEGTVIQVLEDGGETDLRVATSTSGYDDVLYVTVGSDVLGGTHIVENQYIGIYGRCLGQVSYTSALSVKVSIPGLAADSVDDTVKSPKETEIETMLSLFDGADFEKVDTSGYGSYEYVATVTNTTGNDYANVSLILGLYDASGTRIGETYASTNSWSAGEAVRFEGYLDSTQADEATSVKVEVQGFTIGSDYYSPSQP